MRTIEVVRIWNGKLAREGAKSAPWDLLCACTRVSKVVADQDKTPNTMKIPIYKLVNSAPIFF